jgi:hypothetical protein
MPDQNPDTPPTPTPDATPEPQGDPDGLGDAGKRALQAERTARQQAEQQLRAVQEQFEAATAKAAAFEAANTDLTGRVEQQGLNIARLTVAIDKGLPKAFIDRLQGSDEATFAADADSLLALLPQQPVTPAAPRPDPSQGSRAPASTSPADDFAAVFRRATGRS